MKMTHLLRMALLPLSWLYGTGVFLRNKQFDLGIRKSVSFEIPIIAIGNLSAGGTGKTPQAAYLLKLLKDSYKTGLLSRGYRRRTRGYVAVDASMNAGETGDEPMQLKRKFPEVSVSVCESRVIGIVTMIAENPDLEIIVLDDAFQHRQVKPGLSLLITDYSHPYSSDSLLPSGRLREQVDGAKRASAVIVSKCPLTLTGEQRFNLKSALTTNEQQPVFFSFLKYGVPYEIFNAGKKLLFEKGDHVMLFCGIANPDPLADYLGQTAEHVELVKFADHHQYTLNDLKKIKSRFISLNAFRKILITTEKDAVRLIEFREYILSQQLEIYCMPVETDFFGDDKARFDGFIDAFIRSFNPETVT